jgi:hypothetical protein
MNNHPSGLVHHRQKLILIDEPEVACGLFWDRGTLFGPHGNQVASTDRMRRP